MTAISLSTIVHMQGDRIIVSKLLPLVLFGPYAFAYSAISKVTLLTSAVAQAAFPSFSSLFRTEERGGLLLQYKKLHDLLCFGTVPLFAVIPFMALPVFGYVFTPPIASMLLLPVSFLALGFYMNGTLNIPYVFLLAVGKPEISAKANILALFIVLPVTVGLIYFFGLNGAGFSWVFYHLFAYSYAVPRTCTECLGISVRGWYFHILKIFILASMTYGVAWLFVVFSGGYTLQTLALAYVVASLIFMIIAYRMIDGGLRQTLLRFLLVLKIRRMEVL